ncbi:WD40/YVTN/BNR-like repeat-containing protein [Flavihumibacter stibioxidans]|uniref:Photosynthesis system II assembly factor Ycf48/Hcf136-like domain-containing protein n=1 Tax=Flavihumibacter stibioxidans TaxID=1834163 RepID=A0ABR7M3J9_9BACT|nr:YCF48-related protein [Flavihumibacter stibioxidans]MBC6489597.1 hypothetical protein [Flavihumibacter stibioxidans]
MSRKSIQFFIYTLLLLNSLGAYTQQVRELEGRPGISFRGLSVVNERLLWVSGNKGTVGRSTNGGASFTWMTVKGHEQRDFRDIEAFDAVTAVIMAVDSPGIILRTFDGGASWQEVYRDNRTGIFLDAMSFRNDQEGVVIGDPIGGQFVLLQTHDGGRNWQSPAGAEKHIPVTGEAFFAASGTNIQALKKSKYLYASGGTRSRLFTPGAVIDLPLVQGGSTTGANSLAVRYPRRQNGGRYWVVAGGDFSHDTVRTGNIAITRNAGRDWISATIPPFGYRSSVVFIRGRKLISCGTSGVDISRDGGLKWTNISSTGYHVCQRAKNGHAIYLAGGNGRIGKLEW